MTKKLDSETIETEAGTTCSTPMPTTAAHSAASADVDNLGELPRSYGADLLFVAAQEPHWLFAYWDIDISKHPGGPAFLRVLNSQGEIEAEIEVPFETRNWYIPVKEAGAVYTVEIGYRRGDRWHPLAQPAQATTPPDHLSASTDFDFVTLPLHLGFARLMGDLRGAMARGESLSGALARLQREGQNASKQSVASLSQMPEVQQLLEALLGTEVSSQLSSGAMSSGELEGRLRAALEEKLSSIGESSWSAAAAESSLASWMGRLLQELPSASWAVGVPSSAEIAQLSSWLAETVRSWARSAESSGLSAQLSSWAERGESSWQRSEISSWQQAVISSWGPTEVSSWLAGALASWLSAARPEMGPAGSEFSSFGRGLAELSSWARAAESNGFAESLASWIKAAESSWSGASETLSSFAPGREFFMHVNAEVIFYGGTDPRAKVTVDGNPITLNPDGSFRYHFIFPNGRFEIPIVATSPDGVETRSATLRLERGTIKFGVVQDTPQPPLGVPMGAKK